MRHRNSRHRSAGLGLKSVVISKPVPFRWHGWSEGLVTGWWSLPSQMNLLNPSQPRVKEKCERRLGVPGRATQWPEALSS